MALWHPETTLLLIILLPQINGVKLGVEFESEPIAADYAGESPGCVRPINGKTEHFASLPGRFWEGGSLCDSACVEIPGENGEVAVTLPVHDHCLCCTDNQIALSRPVFDQIDKSVKLLKWKLVKCNDYKPACPETPVTVQEEAYNVCPKACQDGLNMAWDGHLVDSATCFGGASAVCTCHLFYKRTLDQCCEPDAITHVEAMLACRETCRNVPASRGKLVWSGLWRPRTYRSYCDKSKHVCVCSDKGWLPHQSEKSEMYETSGLRFRPDRMMDTGVHTANNAGRSFFSLGGMIHRTSNE